MKEFTPPAPNDETIPDPRVPPEIQGAVQVTTLDKLLDMVYNWGRKRSMWPIGFGLACCAIEMIGTAAARFDISRFGMELFRASPRQADLMIVSGTVTKKMVPQIARLYNQMPEPKYVIAMGACATSGGPFKEGYNVVAGVDKYIPVDVYIPGCPPTPQALLYGILELHRKVDSQHITQTPWYAGRELPEYPVPVLGPDIVDVRRIGEITEAAKAYQAEQVAAATMVEEEQVEATTAQEGEA
jgi:NADH-quinone oxidoreductase subunit B